MPGVVATDGTTFRPATADDIALVAEIFARSRAAALAFVPVLHSPQEDRAFFAAYLDTGLITLAEVAGTPAGFMIETPGWIEHLYLEPDRRHRGIGHVLVEHAKSRQQHLQLWCFLDNLPARDFYLRQGFTEIARTADANEAGLPDILFSWQRPA